MLGERHECSRQGVPGMLLVASLLGRVPTHGKLRKKLSSDGFGKKLLRSVMAGPKKDLRDVTERSFHDGNTAEREYVSHKLVRRTKFHCISIKDSNGDECRIVSCNDSGELPFEKSPMRRSVTHISEIQYLKTCSSCRVSSLCFCQSDRSDTKSIDNNGTTPAR